MGANQSGIPLSGDDIEILCLDEDILIALLRNPRLSLVAKPVNEATQEYIDNDEVFVCFDKAIESISLAITGYQGFTINKQNIATMVGFLGVLSDLGDQPQLWVPLSWFVGQLLSHIHLVKSSSAKSRIMDITRVVSIFTAKHLNEDRDLQPTHKTETDLKCLFFKDICPDKQHAVLLRKYGMTWSEYEESRQLQYPICYNLMRGYIPSYILTCEDRLERMLMDGLPAKICQRILSQPALWLLAMHSDDIAKLSYSFLSQTIQYEQLDIIELSALWYHLPVFKDLTRFAWKNKVKMYLDSLIFQEKFTGELDSDLIRCSVYEDDSQIVFDSEDTVTTPAETGITLLEKFNIDINPPLVLNKSSAQPSKNKSSNKEIAEVLQHPIWSPAVSTATSTMKKGQGKAFFPSSEDEGLLAVVDKLYSIEEEGEQGEEEEKDHSPNFPKAESAKSSKEELHSQSVIEDISCETIDLQQEQQEQQQLQLMPAFTASAAAASNAADDEGEDQDTIGGYTCTRNTTIYSSSYSNSNSPEYNLALLREGDDSIGSPDFALVSLQSLGLPSLHPCTAATAPVVNEDEEEEEEEDEVLTTHSPNNLSDFVDLDSLPESRMFRLRQELQSKTHHKITPTKHAGRAIEGTGEAFNARKDFKRENTFMMNLGSTLEAEINSWRNEEIAQALLSLQPVKKGPNKKVQESEESNEEVVRMLAKQPPTPSYMFSAPSFAMSINSEEDSASPKDSTATAILPFAQATRSSDMTPVTHTKHVFFTLRNEFAKITEEVDNAFNAEKEVIDDDNSEEHHEAEWKSLLSIDAHLSRSSSLPKTAAASAAGRSFIAVRNHFNEFLQQDYSQSLDSLSDDCYQRLKDEVMAMESLMEQQHLHDDQDESSEGYHSNVYSQYSSMSDVLNHNDVHSTGNSHTSPSPSAQVIERAEATYTHLLYEHLHELILTGEVQKAQRILQHEGHLIKIAPSEATALLQSLLINYEQAVDVDKSKALPPSLDVLRFLLVDLKACSDEVEVQRLLRRFYPDDIVHSHTASALVE